MPKPAFAAAAAPSFDPTPSTPSTWPRLLTRKLAASYLSVSEDEIDRLVAVGALHVVRLPAARDPARYGAVRATNRRVYIDRAELDDLVTRSRT